MTIKLLTPRGIIPALAIITLDAATETALVGDKVATTDLTGGTVWTGPVDRSSLPSPQAWLPSSVSGAWAGLWANRAQALANGGVTAFFTDIGPGGSYWDYVGNKWRPQARRVVIYAGMTPATLSSATKTVVDYATIPAGIWQDGDILEYAWLAEKDGASDAYTMDVCVGASAASVGTSLGLSTGGLTGTARQLAPAAIRLRRESATSVRPVSVGGAQGTGTNTGANTAVTVSSLDAEAYLQLAGQRTTGTTETLTTRSLIVTLISGS